MGEFDEEIAIVKAGSSSESVKNEFCIAFNPRFMIDALRNTNCDEVKLEFQSELAPIKISPSAEGDNNDSDMLFVVVPVRLK
jgi:DNA polymerase-3 subunit beta